jgi:hypothetical protein
MTREQAQRAMESRSLIATGDPKNFDVGTIVQLFDDDMALVVWDSGIRAPCPIADLKLGS